MTEFLVQRAHHAATCRGVATVAGHRHDARHQTHAMPQGGAQRVAILTTPFPVAYAQRPRQVHGPRQPHATTLALRNNVILARGEQWHGRVCLPYGAFAVRAFESGGAHLGADPLAPVRGMRRAGCDLHAEAGQILGERGLCHGHVRFGRTMHSQTKITPTMPPAIRHRIYFHISFLLRHQVHPRGCRWRVASVPCTRSAARAAPCGITDRH